MGLADLIPDDAEAALVILGGLSVITLLLGIGTVLGLVDQGTFMESAVRDIERTIYVAVALMIFSSLGGFAAIRFLKGLA